MHKRLVLDFHFLKSGLRRVNFRQYTKFNHLTSDIIPIYNLLKKMADNKHAQAYKEHNNNKKRSHTQLDSRKQVIAFQDRVITINIKEAQHPLK